MEFELSRRGLVIGAAMAFAMNGADQSRVDLEIRPSIRGAHSFSLAGRTRVDPASVMTGTAINLCYFGQSNGNSSVNATATPSNGSHIFNCSLAHRGAMFQALEPLLASDLVQGHRGMYLADQLIGEGKVSNVNLMNGAFGGSTMADWSPTGGTEGATYGTITMGDLAYRPGLVARCLAVAGLFNKKTVSILSIGEWSTDDSTSQSNFAASLAAFIKEMKRVGLVRSGSGILYIDQNTRLSGDSGVRTGIRAAQAAAADDTLVKCIVDADSFSGGTYRQDGTHFNATGAAALATTALKNDIGTFVAG